MRMGYAAAGGFVPHATDDDPTSSDVTRANLKTLGTCTSLERVIFKSSYIDRRVLRGLDVDLLFVDCLVVTASGPAGRCLPLVQHLPVVQDCQDANTWYQTFRWPPGVPVLDADMLSCQKAMYNLGHRDGFPSVWDMEHPFPLSRRGYLFNRRHGKRYGHHGTLDDSDEPS